MSDSRGSLMGGCDGWLLWVVAMGGCDGWLLWVDADWCLRSDAMPDSRGSGKILQTTFLDQRDFYGYLKQSRFSFLPQIHDASPRVASQVGSRSGCASPEGRSHGPPRPPPH